MRSKLIIAVVALLLGGVAAVGAVKYLAAARTRIAEDAKPVEILVASQDLPRGMTVEELQSKKLLVTKEIPQEYVPEGAISTVRNMDGQVLAASVSANEPLTRARFQLATEAGLAYSVPASYVAVTIPTDASRGLAGLVKPGDHVAVLGTVEKTGGSGDPKTKVLIPKARVLAVGRSLTPDKPAETAQTRKAGIGGAQQQQTVEEVPDNVTLALSAVDAERLILVQEEGFVWLALLPATATDGARPTGHVLSTVLR